MAVDYASLAETAQRLIEEDGRPATLVQLVETPADPSKPWRGTTGTEVTQSVTAVMVDYVKEDVDGALIQKGDQQVYIAAESSPGIDFQDYQLLRDDEGQEWKIVDMDKIRPGTVTILFSGQLRK